MRLTILAILISVCTAGAALAQEPEFATHDENTDPNLAPVSPYQKRVQRPRREPPARQGRLAINLSFGVGSAGLGDVHEIADYYSGIVDTAVNPNKADFDHDGLKSTFQINAEFGFSYFAPYYILAHVAYGAMYNWSSVQTPAGTLENWNLMMEVPILVGGYYPFKDIFFTYAAIGPSIHFYGHSWWDIDVWGIPDASIETGVGMQALIGMDVMVSETFSVGLIFKGRYHPTSSLTEKGSGTDYPVAFGIPGKGIVSPSRTDYTMDFSGVSVELVLHFWVL